MGPSPWRLRTCLLYTSARGKSGASDASAEVVGKVRRIFEENQVIWQLAELGKTDQGGGGTAVSYTHLLNVQKEAAASDYQKLQELLQQEAAYNAEYDALMETWETLSEAIAAEEGT